MSFLWNKLYRMGIPIGCMYGIFTYIWLIFMVNVGIFLPYMDPMGFVMTIVCGTYVVSNYLYKGDDTFFLGGGAVPPMNAVFTTIDWFSCPAHGLALLQDLGEECLRCKLVPQNESRTSPEDFTGWIVGYHHFKETPEIPSHIVSLWVVDSGEVECNILHNVKVYIIYIYSI